jgi:hypothetical protein
MIDLSAAEIPQILLLRQERVPTKMERIYVGGREDQKEPPPLLQPKSRFFACSFSTKKEERKSKIRLEGGFARRAR